jgi:myo-inositol-1(or 4)-monophosphatase
MSDTTTIHADSVTVAGPWLGACRQAVEALKQMLAQHTTIADRAQETGTRGEGGDHTLKIDAAAEQIVFDQLDRLHADGLSFRAISEERGLVDFGTDGVTDASTLTQVVIDPIDGSLNAKRGLAYHALSLAVASGETMEDVFFGYVYVLGTGEEYWSALGGGAFLNDELLDPSLGERRGRGGRLETLGIESADPRHLSGVVDQLSEVSARLRAHGSIASSLCEVAAGRFDALISLRPCRAVDAAAAQLIVREAGGLVSFPRIDPPLVAPLDLLPHSPVVAARSDATLAQLEGIVG